MVTYLLLLFLCGINIHASSQDPTRPSKLEEQSNVDIVYLWVDGNDPGWQAIKDRYLQSAVTKYVALLRSRGEMVSETQRARIKALLDGTSHNRFNDNEELKYSLRSIYTYAPFVNHIYIVTMNQRPKWLACHPKITVVDHAEIFNKQEDLPTFNSHALESNLHHVPNLSEHFIYFNDDVFLGAPIKPSDFFIGEQLNVQFEKSFSPSGPPIENETTYRQAWRNSNAFLNTHYRVESRYRLCHAPFALRKSYMQQFDDEFPHIFALNSSHKFRSGTDYNVTNGLLQYYWLYRDKIVSHPLSNMMVTLRNDEFFARTKKNIQRLKKTRPITFCLQDNMTENSHATRELLHQFLEEYYPHPAPWEKMS